VQPWSSGLTDLTLQPKIDQIKNVGKLFKKCFGATGISNPKKDDGVKLEGGEEADIFHNGWKSLMNLFDPNLHESFDGIYRRSNFGVTYCGGRIRDTYVVDHSSCTLLAGWL